jgi:hypothetical protein
MIQERTRSTVPGIPALLLFLALLAVSSGWLILAFQAAERGDGGAVGVILGLVAVVVSIFLMAGLYTVQLAPVC